MQANAQRNKLIGHWLIQKIGTPGEVVEISPAYFEKEMYKALKERSDKIFSAEDSDKIKSGAMEAYKEVEGTYFQFNPDGTYAASYKSGDVTKGKFTINESKHSIKLKGEKDETWFYTLTDNNLKLSSEDGQMQVDLLKN